MLGHTIIFVMVGVTNCDYSITNIIFINFNHNMSLYNSCGKKKKKKTVKIIVSLIFFFFN
jgi:hypothetical protein